MSKDSFLSVDPEVFKNITYRQPSRYMHSVVIIYLRGNMVFRVLLILIMGFASPLFAGEEPVRICNDSGEWAPYFYYERMADGIKTGRVVGATIDSLDAIFEIIGMDYEFDLLPWKRCVAFVDRYNKTCTYEMFSEAGVNSWRQEHFLKTKEPVYGRTNVFYYNKEKYPNGLNIKTVQDMEKYKICVPAGFSFERYVKAGLNKNLVDVSHKSDYFDIIRKISLGFCDILPANLAVVEGGEQVGQFRIPDNVAYELDITIKEPFYYYYWIARTSPRAKELRDKIDRAIIKLKKSGRWEKIYRKYLSSGSGLK
jgi:polar amino acid transport system substrate-binding protein